MITTDWYRANATELRARLSKNNVGKTFESTAHADITTTWNPFLDFLAEYMFCTCYPANAARRQCASVITCKSRNGATEH